MLDRLRSTAVFVGYTSFLLGGIGQAGLFGGLRLAYPKSLLAVATFGLALLTLVPWLIVFTMTFLNRPFLSPRAFCFCLRLAMILYAALTLSAEMLIFTGVLPPDGPLFARNALRIMMHAGWLSLPLLIAWVRGARGFIEMVSMQHVD
jgi:hypothetical protein